MDIYMRTKVCELASATLLFFVRRQACKAVYGGTAAVCVCVRKREESVCVGGSKGAGEGERLVLCVAMRFADTRYVRC